MNKTFKTITKGSLLPLIAVLLLSVSGCNNSGTDHGTTNAHGEAAEPEVEKGPHRGRMLREGDFALELAIFETGVPPEFRVWTSKADKPIPPSEIDLNVKLTRLGNKVDNINFAPTGDALRGDMVIYEPHSFVVTINAKHAGKTYTWEYDNFEGRTKIENAVAEALEIQTETAGPAVLKETIKVYGRILPNAENVRALSARFNGELKSVAVSIGDSVKKGQALASVESNESLKSYTIVAPINGVITQRNANPGEQTDDRQLFTIVDNKSVWAELSVFPKNLPHVKMGAAVTVKDATTEEIYTGKVSSIDIVSADNQATNVRVVLNNRSGSLSPGRLVSAEIQIGEKAVDLAVKRNGLQAFRDFTVVYAKIGEEYEVRMLELGMQTGEWAEVLGGLEPGTRYVSENSYVIKADIEKSGASHDH